MTDWLYEFNQLNNIKPRPLIRSSLSDLYFSSLSIAFLFSFSCFISHFIISSSVLCSSFFLFWWVHLFCFLLKFTPSLLLLHFSGSSVTIQVSYTYLLIHLRFYFNLLFYYSFFTFWNFNLLSVFSCSHYPTTRFTSVVDTPENKRLAKQTMQQSEVS